MHEGLFTEELVADVQDRRMMRKRVEGFQALELIQDGPIPIIAFHKGTAGADTVHQRVSTFRPAVSMTDFQEIPAHFVDSIGINQAMKKEIAVLPCAFSEFFQGDLRGHLKQKRVRFLP